jgi:hypothetical protein
MSLCGAVSKPMNTAQDVNLIIPHDGRLDNWSQIILIDGPRRGKDPAARCVAACLV